MQSRVGAVRGEQAPVRAAFDDASVVQHQHLVRLADRAEAVRDDEAGPPAHQAGEGRLEAGLRQGIDRARRLV